jgi:4-carboxymuconolactone decarboxylase
MSYDQTITLGGLFDNGLALRREVLGAAYVDKSLQSTNDFIIAFQHITTEWCGATPGTAPASTARPAAC